MSKFERGDKIMWFSKKSSSWKPGIIRKIEGYTNDNYYCCSPDKICYSLPFKITVELEDGSSIYKCNLKEINKRYDFNLKELV